MAAFTLASLAWLLAAIASAVLLIFAVEVLAGLSPPATCPPTGAVPPFTVLVPAHNEAAGLAATLDHVLLQLRGCDQLLVMADNCTDGTAEVALRAGVRVGRRNDPRHIGKGHALAFGRDLLRTRPTAAVIILDADCLPAPGALALLAEAATREQRPVQGRYLMSVDRDATPMVRTSSFAFLIKNLVRQRGLQRLSGAGLLQGTGFALPWPLFERAPLASTSLVEDMELGLELAMAGRPARYLDTAHFISRAASQTATRSQRTRWEHGSMQTARAYIPRLAAAIARGRAGLLPLAADLLVPPLALLVASSAALAGGLLAIALAGGSVGPLVLLLIAALAFAGSLGAAWARLGRDLLPLAALLRLPAYIMWKQAIYWRFLTNRESVWVRTSRAP